MNSRRRLTTARVGAAVARAVATTAICLAAPAAVAKAPPPMEPPQIDEVQPAELRGLWQQLLAVAAAPFGPQADVAEDAIGDPWWDAVEAGQPRGRGHEPDDGGDVAQQRAVFASVRGQGTTILRRELSLVRQTCPTLEDRQRAVVLEAGREAVDGAVDTMIEEIRRGRGRGRAGVPIPDLDTAIHDALVNALKDHVGDEVAAAYEAERGRRQARRKAAVVAAIVADVDLHAYLDDAEREAVAAALHRAYRDRWRAEIAAVHAAGTSMTNQAVMQGVERCVEKALGKPRKDQWLAARTEAGAAVTVDDDRFAGDQIEIEVQVRVGPMGVGNGAVRRVIRRGEVRVAPAADIEEAAEDPGAEPENHPVEDRK